MTTAFAAPPPAQTAHVAISTAALQQGPPPGPMPGEVVLPTQHGPPQGKPQWPTYQQVAQQPNQQFQPQPQYQPAQHAFVPQQQYAPQVQQPQQFQPQPVYQYGYQAPAAQPQQPVYQQQPAYQPQVPQQPQQQQLAPPQVMSPDPMFGGRPAFQFNDGLSLTGPVGGLKGGLPAQVSGTAPAGSSAANLPPVGAQTPPQQFLSQQPPSTALRDSMVRMGYNVGTYGSDQQLLEDLGTSLDQIQQLQNDARRYREGQFQQQQPQAQQIPGHGQPQAQQPPAGQQPQRPAPPEFRQEWWNLVRRNANTGLFEPADVSVSPMIADQANRYAAWQRDRSQQLVQDPLGTLRQEGLDDILKTTREEIKREILGEFQQQQRETEGQARVRSFMELNKGVFFQLDQQGQPLISPITRQPVMTPRGAAAFQFGQQFRSNFQQLYGIDPDPSQVIEFTQLNMAAAEARGAFGQPLSAQGYSPQGYQPQPQQQFNQQPVQQGYQPSLNDQLKQNTINRAVQMNGAAYQPNQAGTIASAAAVAELPQNARMDFRSMLHESAVRRGLQPHAMY